MFTALNEKPRKKLMTGVCIVHTTDDFCIFSLFFCLFVWNTVVVFVVWHEHGMSQILWLLGFINKTWVLVCCRRKMRGIGKFIRHLRMDKMNCVVVWTIGGLHWTALWFRCNRQKTLVSLMTENMEEVPVSPDELWSQSGWESAVPGTVWSTVILSG